MLYLTPTSFILLALAFVHPSRGDQIPLKSSTSSSNLELSQTSKNRILTPSLTSWIDSLLHDWSSPGLSVAVIRQNTSYPNNNGWEIEFSSHGVASSKGDPLTPDHQFSIASNSKLFTAISTGMLIHNESLWEGKSGGERLTWDSKVKDWINEWELEDREASEGATLRDIFSHRTGLPRHDWSGMPREGGVREMVSNLRYLKPSAPFRSVWQYNNLMDLSTAIEYQPLTAKLRYETATLFPLNILNVTSHDYITQYIFQPLNMTSTFYVSKAEATFLCSGFARHLRSPRDGRNGTLKALEPYFLRPGEEDIWRGAAGVFASAKDLTKWVGMMMNRGKEIESGEEKEIVPESVLLDVERGVAVVKGETEWEEVGIKVYGAGTERYSYQGKELIGSNDGFKTVVTRFINDNLGVIVLSNDEDYGESIIEIVRWRIAEEILGLRQVDWNDRYKTKLRESFSKAQRYTRRPSTPTPPSSKFKYMEKTFFHPTYGYISPCHLQSASPDPSCASLLSSPVLQPVIRNLDQSIPTLITPYKRFFSTHMVFTHFDGNLFNVSLIQTNGDNRRKEGYPEEGDVITETTSYLAEWMDSSFDGQGWGMSGNFWGKGVEAKQLEGDGMQKAEVIFLRN